MICCCHVGKQSCPGDPYEVLRTVMGALQADEIKSQITSLVAHVAECDSVEEILSYGVSTNITCNAPHTMWFYVQS